MTASQYSHHPGQDQKANKRQAAGLLEDATFADVTLTAEGKSLKAHKAVLSAMSPYFKRVLQNNPSPHPIIIMPLDMQFEDLKGIIDYIYMGEIVVPTENLSSLFKAGRVLQISGLTTVDTVGVRAPNTPLFDNVQSMHKDTSGATLSMETNQASETRLDTSRNEDANKLQSSNGSRKSRGSSAALENVSQSEKHTHKCKGANSAIVTVEAAEPSDNSNQKRPETVDLSETESFEKTPTQQQQAKGNCTVISDDDSSRCMFMTDEESQSSDFDYKYFEEQEEELDPLQIHCHTNDDPFHQSASISNGQQCDSFNFVTVKEELED
ncbi:broad-complex, isoform Z5 [Penaeus vannamei]|uniref:Broad-complex, isoform Z5 n=1 Tax=Penaeus vannamei TaxID=6689 RepID=A0A3R7PYN0_PENVA|nr:broad-complex, isoform Z5 [Penaeus vannamei]